MRRNILFFFSKNTVRGTFQPVLILWLQIPTFRQTWRHLNRQVPFWRLYSDAQGSELTPMLQEVPVSLSCETLWSKLNFYVFFVYTIHSVSDALLSIQFYSLVQVWVNSLTMAPCFVLNCKEEAFWMVSSPWQRQSRLMGIVIFEPVCHAEFTDTHTSFLRNEVEVIQLRINIEDIV